MAVYRYSVFAISIHSSSYQYYLFSTHSRLGVTSPPIEAVSPGRSDFTLAQKVNIDYSPYLVRQWITLTRYIENHRQHIFILTFYTLLVIGAFIEKAYGKMRVWLDMVMMVMMKVLVMMVMT
jgi:hypothetical protein